MGFFAFDWQSGGQPAADRVRALPALFRVRLATLLDPGEEGAEFSCVEPHAVVLAEIDNDAAALAVDSAARWFSGEKIDPVNYLPKHIITIEDVEDFMPAQW